MSGRRLLVAALAVPLVALGLPAAALPAGAAPPTWEVGAAKADITPQPYDPAHDARDFPACSTAVFSGPRHFDLEEPYTDAAVDPDVRVLSATRSDGGAVFTVLNQADHNQEIGHRPNPGVISSDWPGYFQREVEARVGGLAVFWPSDIGSIEDPVAVSPPTPQDREGTFGQAEATGSALAHAVLDALPTAEDAAVGTVRVVRDVYDTPLESNLFKAAAASGLFGERQLYTGGQPSGRTGTDLRTSVALVDLGPDIQLVTWPGEAFPALALGSRWGIDEASCPARVDPPRPLWHAHARFRFQVGLGDDMLGYLEPPWGWATAAGVITDSCFTDPQTGRDPAGHPHKLETESVGPQSAADAATHLASLLDADAPDPAQETRLGRFLTRDGTVTRDPLAAVAVWLVDPGSSSTLAPGRGRTIALDGVSAFGSTPVSAHGFPVDGNGRRVPVGDLQTRGYAETGAGGAVLHTWYAQVYPALSTTSPGAVAGSPGALPESRLPAVALMVCGLAGAALLLRRRHRAGRAR